MSFSLQGTGCKSRDQEIPGVTGRFGLGVQKEAGQEVNTDILGISELKWTGMGKFNSDDHFIYYCGQESIRINVVALIVTKESEMQYLGAISKMTE